MRTDTLRSSLTAGLIAAVIWIVITLVTGGGAAAVWLGGLIFFVGTFAISYVISTIIIRVVRR